ncbi:MAG TPA: hypothetical protein DCP28_23850, partial [Cytophagales bacterium]|nr:hypothetical protein [Cytophagales bacterium]
MRYLSLILAFAFCGTLCFAQKQEIHSDPTELIPSTGGGVQFVYTLPVNLEFEDGPLDLTALGTGNTWCWDSSAAANWGWGHFTTNANGAVQGAQDSYLLLPFTVVGTAASVPVISFQLKYNISSSDKVWLEVSDNFATWEVLGTRAVDSGSTGENWYDAAQPYWTGTVADYVRVSFPIVDYQTRPNLFFRLRFESSGQAAGQGVWMDDLRIQEGPLPASSLSVPFSEDFETGAPDWTNASTLWEVGAPTSTRNLFDQTVEGNQALVTELSGTYSQLGDLEVDYFYSPRFNLTDLNEDPVLSFFQGRNMAFEEDDFSVEYTLDAGRTWARLGAFGDSINGPYRHNWYNAQNPDRWNGVLANYEESQHELTGAAGQGKVQFRFRFLSTRQEIAIADGVLIDALTLELPAAQDLKVLEMLPIEFEFDELDTVRVQVLNLGADSATNWTVSLFYDKDSLLSQVSPPALAAGDTADVTLTGFSFSAPDENHLLTAVVSAPGDTRALNDSLTRPIYVRSKATLPLFEEFNGAVQGLTSSAPFQEPGWHLEVAPGGSGTALWASNFSGSSPYSPPTALWFFGNNGTETSVILTADASAYTTADSLYLSFFYRYPADIQNSDEKVWVRGSVYSAWLPLYSWPAESRFDNFGFTGYLDVGQALQAGGQQFTNTFQVRITSNGNAGSSSSPIMIDQFRISDTLPPASVNILSWEDVGRTDFTQAIDTVQGVLTNQGGQTFGDLSVHLYINESPIDSQSLGIFAPFDTVTLTYSNLGLSAPGEYDFRLVALNGEDTVLNSVQYDVITTPLSLPVVQNFEDHQTILEPNQQIPEEPGWVFTGESGSHLELLQNGYGIPGVVGEGAAFLSNKENTIASLIAYVDASALSVSQDHLFLSFYYNLLFFHDTLNTVSVRGSGNDDWISLNVWDFDSPRDTTLYSGLIDLAPVLQSIGQAFSSTTQIRFTHSGFGLLPEQGIMLDGIRLDTQKVTRDLQVAQIRVPDLSLGGGPDTVTVVVANAAELITDSVDVQVTVLDPSGGQLVNTVSTLNGPWGPGTNQELSFTNVDFSTAGQYIVTAVLLNAADQVPNNDSLTVTVTSPPTVVPSSPLAFTFDGCFSSEVVSTDGEVTGSLEGTPVREAGYAQQGITLAGSGSYINLGTASTAVYTESMTVALWLNPATLNQRRWVIGRNRDGQNSGWLLRLRDGKPELALPGTSGPGIFPAGDALVTNTWQHVAFTFSGDTVVAYINGV